MMCKTQAMTTLASCRLETVFRLWSFLPDLSIQTSAESKHE